MVNSRKTKIICTLGPVSESEEMIRKLILAGANVFRMNFSHGDYQEHGGRMERIRRLRKELGVSVGMLMDTKGPEIRTGCFAGAEAELQAGQHFTLTVRDVEGDSTQVSVSYKGLINDIRVGSHVLLDDGLIEMVVEELEGPDIHCRVINGGIIGDRKGINLPGLSLSLPALTPKDIEDIRFAVSQGVEMIAASFVRKAEDVLAIRDVLEQAGGEEVRIIAKIENRQGVDNLEEILQVADAIMVARGDLGVEIPIEEVPMVQKLMIQKCNEAAKPVITATQMLDSMIRNPRPTRAEANDVANAIIDGTDAIMLSGETAKGRYPLECLMTMDRIARRTEESLSYWNDIRRGQGIDMSVTHAVGHAACSIARDMRAAAIITATKSGKTAAMVSSYRPCTPIIAMTMSECVQNALTLNWGVQPLLMPPFESTDKMVEEAIARATAGGYVKDGDIAVISAGVPVGVAGTTNLIKVHVVGNVLIRGKGIGSQDMVEGRVRLIAGSDAPVAFEKGDILVARRTDHTMLPLMRKAAAIITEEREASSHAAIVGMALEIPVILASSGATGTLHDDMHVRVDVQSGMVHNAQVSSL